MLEGVFRSSYAHRLLPAAAACVRISPICGAFVTLVFGLLALTPLNAALACTEGRDLIEFVQSAYGKRIEFDVLRNDKPVGRHTTRFESFGEDLNVVSEMRLNVTIFFVPVYRFAYLSDAIWRGGQLYRLNGETLDNGTLQKTTVRRNDNRLLIQQGNTKIEGPTTLIPTNHWNPAVIGCDRVINTITGKINHVTISPCERGNSAIEATDSGSRCFEYSGELQNRVWYDSEGRWVGLEFTADDGSTITYLCTNCTANPA